MATMSANQDALFVDTLRRTRASRLMADLDDLMAQAVASDRYDWARQMVQKLPQPWSDDRWIEAALNPAVDTHRLTFVQDILNDRPSLIERLRDHLSSHGAGQLFGHHLVTLADPDEAPALAHLRGRLLRQVYLLGWWPQLRAQIEAIPYPSTADTARQRLALWAPDTVREQWFTYEPEAFAEAIATHRAQRALDDARFPVPGDGRRPHGRLRV